MNEPTNTQSKSEPLFGAATRGVKWTFAANIGRQVISFGSVAVLARLIGPGSFGLISLAAIWVAFLELFVNQGLSMAIIQRKNVDSAHLSTAFWTSIAFSVVLALLSVALAPYFGLWMNEPRIVPVIRVLSFTFPLSALSGVQGALLNRALNFRALALRTLIATIVSGIFGVTAALLGMGVWSLVIQQLAAAVAQVVVLWRTSTWRPKFEFSVRDLRDLLSFSTTVLTSNIFSFLSSRFDQLIVGKQLGPEQLGLYSMAKRLPALIGDSVAGPITSVALPVFSRIQDQPERSRDATENAQRILCATVFPIFALLAVLSAHIIRLVFGETWLAATPVFSIFAVERFIGVMSALAYPLLMSAGRQKLCLTNQVLHTIGSIAAALIGGQWGATGIAYARLINCAIVTTISIVSLSTIPWFQTGRFLKVNLAPLLSSVMLVAAVLVIQHLPMGFKLPYIFSMAIESTIGLVVYAIALWLTSKKHVDAVIVAIQRSISSRRTKKA